jgi:hypothetical protein
VIINAERCYVNCLIEQKHDPLSQYTITNKYRRYYRIDTLPYAVVTSGLIQLQARCYTAQHLPLLCSLRSISWHETYWHYLLQVSDRVISWLHTLFMDILSQLNSLASGIKKRNHFATITRQSRNTDLRKFRNQLRGSDYRACHQIDYAVPKLSFFNQLLDLRTLGMEKDKEEILGPWNRTMMPPCQTCM